MKIVKISAPPTIFLNKYQQKIWQVLDLTSSIEFRNIFTEV